MDDLVTRERRRAREDLLADRRAAMGRRQWRRVVLRLPRTLPVPATTARPHRSV